MAAIAAAFFLLSAPAPAQVEAGVRVLTWEDCVSLAQRGNPDLAAASLAAEARRAGYRGSFNGLLPSLALSNGWSDSSGSSGGRWSAAASASLELFNAARYAAVRSASAQLSQAEAARLAASADARFNLRQAFSRLLFSSRGLDVSRAIRDLRARGSRLVELRYDSGRESKGNMLRARAQLAQAEADLRQSSRGLRVEARSLGRHLGLDGYEVLAATGTLAVEPPEPLPAGLEALASARPDVAARRAAVDSASAALSSARATLWPTLSADYTRSRSGPSEFPGGPYAWTGAVTLSYPLFGGGPTSTYYAVKAGARSLESARQQLRAASRQAEVELESSWADYAAAADQVAVQRALLAAARQRNEEADVRYASGLMSYDNWEIIATDRVNTERRALQAELEAAVAGAAWDRALGRGLGL